MRNNKKSQIINLFKRLEHFELFPIYQLPLVGNPSIIFCRAKAPRRKEIPPAPFQVPVPMNIGRESHQLVSNQILKIKNVNYLMNAK